MHDNARHGLPGQLLTSFIRSVVALFRNRREQAIVELALRQQLAVYVQIDATRALDRTVKKRLFTRRGRESKRNRQ